jgi:hypothetical protein
VDGQRSGLGAYYFTNFRIYEGQWRDGVRDGTGLFFLVQGSGDPLVVYEFMIRGVVVAWWCTYARTHTHIHTNTHTQTHTHTAGVERYEHTRASFEHSAQPNASFFDDDELQIRKPSIVTYKEGGLVMRKPHEGNAVLTKPETLNPNPYLNTKP